MDRVCGKCGKKLKSHSKYNDTKFCRKCYVGESKICFCLDCNKKLNESAYYRGDKRCPKCNKIGNLNPFYGKKLTEEHKTKISKNHYNVKGKNNPMYGKITHGKGSYYTNIWMRSSYEILFAKWLDKQNIKWIYEYKTFDLGDTTYTPDFYLPEFNLYIEVKGFWRNDAKKKFIEFQQRYCGERIKIVDKLELNNIGVL